MKINTDTITTPEQARQIAIDWQNWASEQSLSYGELNQYQAFFLNLQRILNL
jgi:hypothetical protein